jgi:hypothetical protein
VGGDRWDVCYCDRFFGIAWVTGSGAVPWFGVLFGGRSGLGLFSRMRSRMLSYERAIAAP